MGQKVHPIGFRLGITENWRSRWFAEKEYRDFVVEDMKIREHIMKKMKHGAISRVEIERKSNEVRIDIYTARPGVVIGRKGAEVESLRKDLEKLVQKPLQINIKEVKIPELDANLIAQSVAEQIEARVSHRRAMKRAIAAAKRFGVKGIKIACAGRLGGVELARREWYREGRVPLHTLRAKIDYGFAEAYTKYGRIGVKVWLYLGDILPSQEERVQEEVKEKAKEKAEETEEKVSSRSQEKQEVQDKQEEQKAEKKEEQEKASVKEEKEDVNASKDQV